MFNMSSFSLRKVFLPMLLLPALISCEKADIIQENLTSSQMREESPLLEQLQDVNFYIQSKRT